MNHWAFVVAAYGVSLTVLAALVLWAWSSMRLAEQRAEQLRRK